MAEIGMTKEATNTPPEAVPEIDTQGYIPGPPGTVLNDSATVNLLRDFLHTEKPPGTTPVDILHVIHLALRKAMDHNIFDSQLTLAHNFCVDIKTIVRSSKAVSKNGLALPSPPTW
jgi:hypothetical protein